MQRMIHPLLACLPVAAITLCLSAMLGQTSVFADPEPSTAPGPLTASIQPYLDDHTIAGAVMVVADKKGVLAEECAGYADPFTKRPMTPDSMFCIASMTKSFTATGVTQDARGWAAQVYPYVKSTAAFACPDDPSVVTKNSLTNNDSIVSYGFNWDISETQFTGFGVQASLPKFNSPAMTILLFECMGVSAPITDPLEGGLPNNGCPATGHCFNQNTDMVGNGTLTYSGYGSVANLPQPLGSYTTIKSQVYTTGVLGYSDLLTLSGSSCPGQDTRTGTSQNYPNGGDVTILGRHTGGANYVFTDGHVKWCAPQTVSPGFVAPSPTSPSTSNYGGCSAVGTQGVFNSTHVTPAATFSPV